MDLITGDIGLHAAPIIVGRRRSSSARRTLQVRSPKSCRNVKGHRRGYDVRTGKRLWTFHTIPVRRIRERDLGERSWSYTGNTGVWAQMSADEELGIVYLPVESPTGDYYGGHRPGNNLFSESLVAVEVKTGQRLWHYQLVHHGIWDWDIPCAPMLMDITVDGKPIKAVAQPTKQGWLYVFDRVTGQPVWPIEERPVPKVGRAWREEQSRRSRSRPSRQPTIAQGLSIDDLIDFTPELRAEAGEARLAAIAIGPIFTPPVVSRSDGPAGDTDASIVGATNWPGGVVRSGDGHRLSLLELGSDHAGAGDRSEPIRHGVHPWHADTAAAAAGGARRRRANRSRTAADQAAVCADHGD